MGWRGGISLHLDLSEFVVVVSRETLNVSRETLTVDSKPITCYNMPLIKQKEKAYD